METSTLFLVLDDVWTDDGRNWESLKATFQHCKKGSRILVTTRKDSVVKVMESSHIFPLEKLSDELCWMILSQVAFIGRKGSECEGLEDVGKEIAKKCKGLPLAAKTLGSLLREKSRVEWLNVLNSEFWKLEIAEKDMFRPLLLSYYDLHSTIRRCLLYCAIFPKDYVMLKDELSLHWMLQGFLNFSEMKDKGREYFGYLANRSFFQDFKKDTSGNIYKCKMHDLIRDFLQFLTKDEVVSEEFNSGETLKLDSSSKKARHSRITIGQGKRFPVSVNGVEKLWSLITIGQGCDATTRKALRNLFKTAKCLRLLEFGFSSEPFAVRVENVPEEIGNLIHLRYPCFHFSENLEVPESVCELRNLQYLNLYRCENLKKPPDKMEKLINLKYLYTSSCDNLAYYPKGIGRLTGLRRLDGVVARVDRNDAREFSVGDLENLDLLCEDLKLVMVGNSVDIVEAKRAKLHKKIHLTLLKMTWKDVGTEMKDNNSEALNSPGNLYLQWRP